MPGTGPCRNDNANPNHNLILCLEAFAKMPYCSRRVALASRGLNGCNATPTYRLATLLDAERRLPMMGQVYDSLPMNRRIDYSPTTGLALHQRLERYSSRVAQVKLVLSSSVACDRKESPIHSWVLFFFLLTVCYRPLTFVSSRFFTKHGIIHQSLIKLLINNQIQNALQDHLRGNRARRRCCRH